MIIINIRGHGRHCRHRQQPSSGQVNPPGVAGRHQVKAAQEDPLNGDEVGHDDGGHQVEDARQNQLTEVAVHQGVGDDGGEHRQSEGDAVDRYQTHRFAVVRRKLRQLLLTERRQQQQPS